MAGSGVLVDHIRERAMRDESFRTSLIDDPRTTIEQELGITIPSDTTVTVIQERPNEYCIVLPNGDERTESGDTDSDTELY